MQSLWATLLNPLLGNPLSNGQLLDNVNLVNGTNIINHTLGRKLQGWIKVLGGSAIIYDNQSTNPTPQLTLSLTSSAAVTVSLWVF
jgi:hypothetical protein